MKYNEIIKLKKMLDAAKIVHIIRPFMNGYQIILETGDDIIEHDGSYGRTKDLLEVMGDRLVDEEHKGDVQGHLTADEVFRRIKETETSHEQSSSLQGTL